MPNANPCDYHRALYWSAREELKNLHKHAEITGCNLRELVEIPPRVRADMERFCTECPRDAKEVREAMLIRDWMLERL